MSDKVIKGGKVDSPVNMHKSMAAGETYKEAAACALKNCGKSSPPAKR